ncbi:cardiolipin synthase [Gehongia tenuis]|uniref:Cardiolipin synthase n=1 Tax=Gehongia tenuis TaxID=2763655 RepID=A0A926D5D4_9FIRM|nr:cardiolipin synthase [Gehongia tenuis]MBC8531658.1 cardiolipin synthase [Gehongia tenuis]
MEFSWWNWNWIINIILLSNLVFILVMIFYERSSPGHTITWTVVMTFLPWIGFLLYIFLGAGLGPITRKQLEEKKIKSVVYTQGVKKQIEALKSGHIRYHEPALYQNNELVHFNLLHNRSLYTQNNKVEIFTHGVDKFEALERDLLAAKHTINMCYFIFRGDETGERILDILCQKAREGVEVRLMYDAVGNAFIRKRIFNRLKKAGGKVCLFFPAAFGLKFVTLRLNYRNHRKIVVIDGQTCYTGGMNVGDEYKGLHPRVHPWRDTHIRLEGSCVETYQGIFLSDWQYASKEKLSARQLDKFFPGPISAGTIGVQVVESGPDDESNDIELSMIKLLSLAKDHIYLQSPYFIPDDPFLEAVEMAIGSGVDVRIMLPGVWDKAYAYHGNMAYVDKLLKMGVKVYLYHGFIHSKSIVVDGLWSTIGTTNLDIRSFALHFEVNSFFYDHELARRNEEIFFNDMKHSTLVTREWYNNRGWFTTALESVLLLFSPIL